MSAQPYDYQRDDGAFEPVALDAMTPAEREQHDEDRHARLHAAQEQHEVDRAEARDTGTPLLDKVREALTRSICENCGHSFIEHDQDVVIEEDGLPEFPPCRHGWKAATEGIFGCGCVGFSIGKVVR